MRTRRAVFALGASAVLLAAWITWRLAYGGPDIGEAPASWGRVEIAKEVYPHAGGPAYVLAWKIEQGERPLRVESCLVLRLFEGSQECWLAHLYRHPLQGEPKWQLSQMHVSGTPGADLFPGVWITHLKTFPQRPSNDDLYAALDCVAWSFEEDESMRLVQCGVCRESWQEAIGEEPTKFFAYRPRGVLETLRLKNWFGCPR